MNDLTLPPHLPGIDDDPLDDGELFVPPVEEKPAATEAVDDDAPFASELALSEQFAAGAAGTLRWSPGLDWMVNAGAFWERDDKLTRFNQAKTICRDTAKALGDNKRLAAKICSSATVAAVLTLAKSHDELATPVDAWDAHPMLLNTPTDVIDLENGRTVSRAGLLFTQATAVAPRTMPTPAWEKFLAEIFAGDLGMMEFMQRMAGYCLTGATTEQKLFFMYGSGSNGKSVLLDALRAIVGRYAHNLPAEALMRQAHEGHPTMFAALHGKRLAISSEIEESAHWAESRIKALTGDETLTARFMRQDFFEFRISHKHVIAGNFKPRLKGDDFAMARRLVLVPFAERFEGARRDNTLAAKLRAEYPGILAWAIQGARKWASSGLAIPASVTEASASYFAEHNDIELWLAECCERSRGESESVSTLYGSFKRWKERGGEHAPSVKSFSQRLERVFERRKTRHGAEFVGLRLVVTAFSPDDYLGASRGD